MTTSPLKGKWVLVTGAHGFLGRHVVELLHACGAYYWTPQSKDYDLRARDDVERLFDDVKHIDVLIHLAARVGGIQYNRDHAATVLYDNLLMNTNVIEAASRRGVGKVVCAGSVCAYPDRSPVPFVEENLWEGLPEASNAGYGIAKRVLLYQLQAYRKERGLNGIYLLPTNFYGPGDHFEPERSHVIAALIAKFHKAKRDNEPTVTVWGTGKATRDFLYVKDAARAFVIAAEKYDGPEPINLGSGQERTISHLAAMLKVVVGYRGQLMFDSSKPDGQMRRAVNTARAMKVLGWQAATRLEDGLLETMGWYSSQQPVITQTRVGQDVISAIDNLRQGVRGYQ